MPLPRVSSFSFVGVFHAIATHHGLHRLGEDFPAGVQVLGDALGVQLQLADALQAGLVGDDAVGDADAEVAQHGGVGQVALPARDRQLAGQVLEQRVGDAEVALGVLEVDRVDLVRHGRGADLAGHGLLLEIAEGDVAPDVAVEVDEDGVEAGDRIEQLGDVVVRLDLSGVGLKVRPRSPSMNWRALASQSTSG